MGSNRTDILTPAQEAYARERAKGATQRAAYRAAYPGSAKWKDSAVDSAACRLEATGKVSARLRALQEAAARAATVTRAEIIDAQGLLLRKGREAVERHSLADKEMAPAVKALADASDRLMEWLPTRRPRRAPRSCGTSRCCSPRRSWSRTA